MPLRPHQQKALDKMNTHRKGQVIVPTGGGKTMCMIEDAKRRFAQDSLPKTIVVVAQRQMCIRDRHRESTYIHNISLTQQNISIT